MRKLTYDIFTKNGTFAKNVTTYAEAENARANGYTVKEKMVDMVERLFYDCYKEGKVFKTVTLNEEAYKIKESGFEVKPRLAWVEV